MEEQKTTQFRDSEEDRRAQEEIRSGANRAIAALEYAMWRRYGQYIHLHPDYRKHW